MGYRGDSGDNPASRKQSGLGDNHYWNRHKIGSHLTQLPINLIP